MLQEGQIFIYLHRLELCNCLISYQLSNSVKYSTQVQFTIFQSIKLAFRNILQLTSFYLQPYLINVYVVQYTVLCVTDFTLISQSICKFVTFILLKYFVPVIVSTIKSMLLYNCYEKFSINIYLNTIAILFFPRVQICEDALIPFGQIIFLWGLSLFHPARQ